MPPSLFLLFFLLHPTFVLSVFLDKSIGVLTQKNWDDSYNYYHSKWIPFLKSLLSVMLLSQNASSISFKLWIRPLPWGTSSKRFSCISQKLAGEEKKIDFCRSGFGNRNLWNIFRRISRPGIVLLPVKG